MTTYHPYGVNLSEGQKEKLARAYKTNTSITIRLSKSQTTGSDELLLTKNQINKIIKAKSLGNGVEVKISKTQIRKVMRKGGSLFSAIIPLAKSLAPTLAKTLGLSALSGLASEGASQVVKKMTGRGQRAKRSEAKRSEQTGGFLIPQDKIEKLIANKKLLTSSQKQQLISALESGGGQVIVIPTKRQSGGLLGSLLASIGIPLAIEAIKKMTGNGAPRMGLPKEGYGAPRIGMYPYETPPFYGGCKKKGGGLLLGKNSPFNSIPIIGAPL